MSGPENLNWDEISLDWIDHEIARTGNSIIEETAMPESVVAFVKRKVEEQYYDPETDDRITRMLKSNHPG